MPDRPTRHTFPPVPSQPQPQTIQVIRQITHNAFNIEVQRDGQNLILLFVGPDGQLDIFPLSPQGEADLRMKMARGAVV